MEISATKLNKVLLIKPDIFEDFRGEYMETYNEELYQKSGIGVKFVQDDISVSAKNVLRGIHGDNETWKLISCLYGKFYLVVVNCDTESSEFGKWQAFTLSDKNRLQVLVPPKYGNGHLVLSEITVFHYKQSTYYQPEKQFTYKWNNPKFNIWWPTKSPILSQRDELGHR
ncbi:MAG: dTDP-4-keto-6-deoxy-D-glucose epimerase [Candidatus Nealsonbacteria bacterium CG08_land_8_20_14_0_20_43_11]|uniref:dTDP-4-keto-6-deoxy-D-glucose epimerase n=1 Tax=Candidatus Nealsonbacteria bacterium CG08_land_8_20_14_0_20_43_11 TaxID=1974706 RepID=A0A2M6T133_9BACT|nr:MAG: dTDP-4-keto-6-deoxy-D-glucose epimerase [Candidatus Nealsonbacteria bacterium CG08_land_8_20_14_0_20_43_11]